MDEKIKQRCEELQEVMEYVLPQLKIKFVYQLHEHDLEKTIGYRAQFIRSDGQSRYAAYRMQEFFGYPIEAPTEIVLNIFKQIIEDELDNGKPEERKEAIETGVIKEVIDFREHKEKVNEQKDIHRNN